MIWEQHVRLVGESFGRLIVMVSRDDSDDGVWNRRCRLQRPLQWLRRREDENSSGSAADGFDRAIDLSGVLAQPLLGIFRDAQMCERIAIPGEVEAYRAVQILRKAGHLEQPRPVRGGVDQTHLSL